MLSGTLEFNQQQFNEILLFLLCYVSSDSENSSSFPGSAWNLTQDQDGSQPRVAMMAVENLYSEKTRAWPIVKHPTLTAKLKYQLL